MKTLLAMLALEVVALFAAVQFEQSAETLVLLAAALAAAGYVWRSLLRPATAAIQRAAHVYELLVTDESGFVARIHRVEGSLKALGATVDELLSQSRRLDRVEELVQDIRKAVGTRGDDHEGR